MDYMNQLHRHMRPEDIQRNLEDYNRPVQNDRSIDDCLDNTNAFVQWAQRKAPQYDPENRQPLPSPNNDPLSDYEIEFTRLNKTDQVLSSLSSLNIPTASNTSLSVLSNGTPRVNIQNRRSSVPIRSTNLTPSLFIRHKQSLNIGLPGRRSENRRDSENGFSPQSASTPIRAERKRASIFENLAGNEEAQNQLVDSSSNSRTSVQHDTLTNNKNTSTPTDRTYQKVTQASQVDESELTLVPTVRPVNESVIPETQDDQISEDLDEPLPETDRSGNVSNVRTSGTYDARVINRNTLTPKDRTYRKMTQGSQIDGSDLGLVPKTQPANGSVIPETQGDPIPETQEEQTSITERNNSIVTTPTRSQRKNASIYENTADAEKSHNQLVDSESNSRATIRHNTHTINGITFTPKNRTYRMSTLANQINRSRPILVPETQPSNESVIPETQDDPIPETQEEHIPEPESTVSASNARASDKRDTLTNNRNSSISANKPKRNPVVLLSPLSEEIQQKYNTKRSTVPMDLVFTPPTNFQNSRRTSQLENDDLIVEASPSTCAMRKKQLEQQNFDQFSQTFFRKPDADHSSQSTSTSGTPAVKRKRGRRKSENPQFSQIENISTNSNRYSLPSNSRGRRLTSLDALRNDADDDDGHGIEQDIGGVPATSTSDRAQSTADENVFKMPEIPRRKSTRKSKADNFESNKNQTNDSIANGNTDLNTNSDANENASTSTSRRMSHDSFDFSVHIEPINDDELRSYMPQNDTTLPDHPKGNAKDKKQKPKAKADSKPKPKRAQPTVDTDDVQTLPRRRPSREAHRDNFRDRYLDMLSIKPAAPKQRSKSTKTDRRAEMGPPKKKIRTESELRRKATQPPLKASNKTMTSSKTNSKLKQSPSSSIVSGKSKLKTDQTPSSSSPVTSSENDKLAKFLVGLDEKRLMATEFWKDINDYEKDNDNQQEDILYIKTKYGIIEASNHKQIDYVEIEDVKYGFVASTEKRYGLMRFKPGAKKSYEKSSGIIYLFVLQGCFEIRGEDGKLEIRAPCESVIKKGVFYEITNKGKKTGIIQFEYTE